MSDGLSTQAVVLDHGIVIAYRHNVREPRITGLAAWRKAKRDGVAAIASIAAEEGATVRFDRMRIHRDPPLTNPGTLRVDVLTSTVEQ